MTNKEFGKFRERVFPGKFSKQRMSVEFGVRYNTLRRYEGRSPLPIPEVLAKSIEFYGKLLTLEGK